MYRIIKIIGSCLFLLISFTSCWTLEEGVTINFNNPDKQIKKHAKYVENLTKGMLHAHGNVFYLCPAESTTSTLWYYINDKITILKVDVEKIKATYIYPVKDYPKQSDIKSEDDLLELNNCVGEGIRLGIMLKKDQGTIQTDMPVDIYCITNSRYGSPFLTKMTNDINRYSLSAF